MAIVATSSTARSVIRSSAIRSIATRLGSQSKAAQCPFRIPSRNPSLIASSVKLGSNFNGESTEPQPTATPVRLRQSPPLSVCESQQTVAQHHSNTSSSAVRRW
ncbi:Uncharacterized protein Adt_43211 [Abeliophyllum distichum]|uniref:Uncharacterized protein n=1 Tax=Abeliophyllum distichum TaxID=126358 RepID=A0ABD1PTV1_9LAMI